MVKPVAKYAVTILKANKIRYHLERAFYLANTGRPGPVLIDIPLDIQSAMLDISKLTPFSAPEKTKKQKKLLKNSVKKTIKLLNKSKRPLIVAGHGLRLSRSETLFQQLIKKLNIPIVLTTNNVDFLPDNQPLNVGRFGPFGQRKANFAIQNADLILSIGASLNTSTIGFNYQQFAPKAKKIMVNIDQEEMSKKNLKFNLAIKSDAGLFLKEFIKQLEVNRLNISSKWINACQSWGGKYPAIIPDFYHDKNHTNSYVFFDVLSDYLKNENTLVTGNSLDACGLFQAFKVKKGQRAFTNLGFGSMGWGLPASIGACIANRQQTTICVTGDGSIQMNIQELATINYYQLPIKIFIFNNRGYASIRRTQRTFFKGRIVGADEKSGVNNPDFKLIAAAHKIKYLQIKNNHELKNKIKKALNAKGPVLCEVILSYHQERIPRIISYKTKNGKIKSKPLHDMYPFLSKKELKENMNIFLKS